MTSGIVCHLLPFLPYQPSLTAISILTAGDVMRSPVSRSIAQAMRRQVLDGGLVLGGLALAIHPLGHLVATSFSPRFFSSKRSGEKRPQPLIAAMILRRPARSAFGKYTGSPYMATISGSAPMRCAMLSDTTQLATGDFGFSPSCRRRRGRPPAPACYWIGAWRRAAWLEGLEGAEAGKSGEHAASRRATCCWRII